MSFNPLILLSHFWQFNESV